LNELFRHIGAFGRPVDVSAQGWRSDEAFGWITLVLVVVFAIVVGQLVLVFARSRKTPSATRGDDRIASVIVLGTTILFGIVVDGVALFRSGTDLRQGFQRTPSASERPVEVEVLAQQWIWSFRLAGPDGKFGTDDDVVTLKTLHLPAGRPAKLELRSKDVIHSLYVPQLRIKRDAQPGETTTLLLEPTRAGEYEIACAQHCGANHYLMRGTLVVTDDDTWGRFVASEGQLGKERIAARASDGDWAWTFGAAP
jgi:cytochrome c oxidase subunit 2